MAEPQAPDVWAGVATQYVGAWGSAAPVVQIAAIIAVVIVVAILAWAWSRRREQPDSSGVPVEAFAHVVEEQARQTEALRSAVEGLSEIVHQIRLLLEARTLCPYGEDRRDA
jgi:membrane protein implicated in regulation of membrane protease activity